MKNNPLVSILIANYNKASYLKDTLDSVLSQTYANWECIIVDDHSTDDSWEILDEYVKLDLRFRIFKRPLDRKKGGNAARNFAFENSIGEYIQWLDSDDLIHKDKIYDQVFSLFNTNNRIISISNWLVFKSNLESCKENIYCITDVDSLNRWEYYPSSGFDLLLFLFENQFFIPIHSYLIPSLLIQESGLWNEDLTQNQDGEFMTRVLLKADKLIYLESIHAYYRKPNINHLSRQTTLKSYQDWYTSFVSIDQNIFGIKNSKEITRILIKNYQFLIKLTGLEFPSVTEQALNRIKFLNPNVRFDLSKPPLFWMGSLIGFNNFLLLRHLFLKFKLIKN